MRQLKMCSNQIDFLNICQFSFQIVLKIKQGYTRNISKLITFIFRNRTIFWTSQNGIEDKQTGTEAVLIHITLHLLRISLRVKFICFSKGTCVIILCIHQFQNPNFIIYWYVIVLTHKNYELYSDTFDISLNY